MRWLGWLFLILLFFWHPLLCQNNPLEYVQILESAERVRKLQVPRVVAHLGAQPGDKVADLGAGSGLFTRPLARNVGAEGVVYAVDINGDLLEHIDETAGEEGLGNIETVLASEYDPKIPEKVDLVLICDTLHQIENPGAYLGNLANYLAESGRVAIIDYEKEWPQRLEGARYTPFDLDAWMTAAGFDMEKKFDFLLGNFFVIYRYKGKETSRQ